MSTLVTSIQRYTGGSSQYKRVKKEIKGLHVGKKEENTTYSQMTGLVTLKKKIYGIYKKATRIS